MNKRIKSTIVRKMDVDDIDFRYVIWCDIDGTNDGTADDKGYLQGATIITSEWTLSDGLTETAKNTNSVIINGITYPVNTVSTIKLSVTETAARNRTAKNKIVTSDGRTLHHTLVIPII